MASLREKMRGKHPRKLVSQAAALTSMPNSGNNAAHKPVRAGACFFLGAIDTRYLDAAAELKLCAGKRQCASHCIQAAAASNILEEMAAGWAGISNAQPGQKTLQIRSRKPISSQPCQVPKIIFDGAIKPVVCMLRKPKIDADNL